MYPPLQPCHPVACILRPAIRGPTIQALSSCWVLATSILVVYNTSCRHDAASSRCSESSHAICITSLATLQLSMVLYDQSIGWAFSQDQSTKLQGHTCILCRTRTYRRNNCFGLESEILDSKLATITVLSMMLSPRSSGECPMTCDCRFAI